MFDVTKLVRNRNLLANLLFAGSVFLLLMGNALAVPDLSTSSASFTSADPARANNYMDAGGVWSGLTEVSSVGDTFTITVTNTAVGLPADDTAFDLQDILVNVDAGFTLASGTLNINNVVGLPTCPTISVGVAEQPGGTGTQVRLNIGANEDILPGCSYELSFGLTTSNAVTAGVHPVSYAITYDDNLGNPLNTPVAQNIDVNTGGLSVTKSTVAISATATDIITYNVTITSTGSGGLFDVELNDVLSSDLNGLTFNVPNPPPGANGPDADDYTIEYLAAGEVLNLTVDATVTPVLACPILQNTANVSERIGAATDTAGPVSVQYDFQFTSGLPGSVIAHDAVASYCEFCDDGTITVRVLNTTGADMTNIVVVEDLQISGLEYIAGSATANGAPTGDPGIAGSQLTWSLNEIPQLANLAGGASVVITFGVRSTVAENLIIADRDIIATADFDMSCLVARQSVDTGQFQVPIRQPLLNILKDGRNFDAGQGGYSDPIYGNENDDVIWRVNVQNAGLANAEALLMNDSIDGNFIIGSICPDEASAVTTAGNDGAPAGAGCISMAGNNPFDVTDFFGNALNPDDIAATSVDAFIYYVGRIQAAHTNNTNTNNISWGCAVDSPTGGLITVPATGGVTPGGVTIIETGDLNTFVTPAGLDITQTVTGSNVGQPLGTKGLVTVVIDNQTGGSVTNIELENIVPAGYVVDGTYGSQAAPADCDCTVIFDPAYGPAGATYPGFIDTVERIDGDRDDGDPLNDLLPRFRFTSSAASNVGAEPNQQNILRNGDILTLRFGIVMIDPVRFDLVADLDVAPENTGDNTDPTNALALTSSAEVSFDASDGNGVQTQTQSNDFDFNSDPEDLDIDISDALFILTNDPGVPLDLTVLLTNNGGHEADDYTAYISFGQAMTVQVVPADCVGPVANPPPEPHWNDPAEIPTTAAVYACDRGVIAPGATETFTFEVVKAAAAADDDLTFRADVVGEVTLFNTDPLTFPTPPTIPDTTPNVAQLANNYSFDAIRSRVLGFNLVKSAWYCAEDGLLEPAPPSDMLLPILPPGGPVIPPLVGNLNSQIGEDCAYRIESGGWFGFLTPGFTLIAVQNVAVTDDLPDGQGFISFDGSPFNYSSTSGINLVGPDGGAGTIPLDETDITWNFNAAGNGITLRDLFFRVDVKTRLLNDPDDTVAPLYPVPGAFAPNLHGNLSTNVARTSFDAVFNSTLGNVTISVNDGVDGSGNTIPGFPVPAVRTISLTDVEPNLIVTKTVCNESLNGPGVNCNGGVFEDAINDGDTNDSYIYRITLENQTSSPVRSPAFNVISTDTLDASDLMFVVDFADDLLDNDGDGVIDEADEAVLYASIPDNIIGNATPAVITVNETFNVLLEQVDPGAVNAIEFYYRVDPDITIAPLQTLTNTVSMTYDSLEADFGNQNIPMIPNGGAPDSGRARIYTSIAQTADVQMIPVIALPKLEVATANTPNSTPQNVSIGEEVRYLLVADLPVANLRQLTVRDELPAGTTCIQLQDINLSQGVYALAGFVPGGPPVSTTCSGQIVEWNFGDQIVTAAGGPGTRFNFPVTFVARVDNSAANNENVTLTNGGGTLDTTPPPSPLYCTGGVGVCYVNEANTVVAQDFLPIDIVVREPVITLTKSFSAPDIGLNPVLNSDAADVLTVTVTAENIGTAAAYNLQVRDDLVGSDMTYILGTLGGANPPDIVDVSDPNRPVFSWTPPPLPPPLTPRPGGPDYEILPGVTKTFTFQVRVDTSAQPLETLDNTIEAKWDSLPDRYTTLNTLAVPSTIGLDGTALGLRNGAVPNASDPINDYETTALASTEVPPLIMTKTDLDDGVVVPTIGAHREFQIIINLPEGTTEDLVVNDNLIFSGISYALRRDGVPAGFDVSYQFINIVSINSLPPAEAVFRGATAGPPTLPIDGDTGNIVWDIGQVITAEEDDLDANANIVSPQIIINYFARPNNDDFTNNGDDLQNSVTTTYDNGEDGTEESLNATTAIQEVVEPLLQISKAVSNISNLGVGPVAGDILQYQITISHDLASTAAAFDSNIVDTLDDNLLFDGSFPPTALLDGGLVGGFTSAPIITLPPATTLTWGRVNSDNSLDIPLGSTLVITYQTIVQNSIEANVIISNSALVDWTSLDDTDPSNAFERTGAGCPAVIAPNDYCSLPAQVDITADDRNSILKNIIFDSYDEFPLSNALDSIVRVGDTATYQLEINIQPGITASVIIVDDVPPGMELVDIISINGVAEAGGFYASPAGGSGSNFSYAPIPVANVPLPGAVLTFTWNLGTITNDFAGDPTTDTLVVEYRARVVDNVAATINQQPTTTLTNTVNFTYMDGIGNPSPADARLTDNADLIVLQPVMDDPTKTDPVRLSGTPINPAADIMNFTLQSCNTTGLARAYGLQLTDDLPTQLNENTITGPTNGVLAPDVYINGVLATAVTDYIYTPPAVRGGNMIFNLITPVDPGACVDVVFDVAFYTDFGFGPFSNLADIDEYYSMPPANAQLYGPLVQAEFVMNNPLVAIPPPAKIKLSADDATIGDEVIYQITVPSIASGAALFDVTITDILNPSQVYVSAIDTSVNNFTLTDNTVLPGNVSLVIGQIPAGQQAIIELRVRVDNNLSADAGVSFNNVASYSYANSPGDAQIAAGSDSTVNALTIVEPFVTVGKTVTNETIGKLPADLPDAGDVLRYTVTLTASGGGVAPADFNSDAFDLIIDDSLSLGLTYINNSVTINGGNIINQPVIAGDGILTPQTLSWSPANNPVPDDIDVAEGTVVTIIYDVLVLDRVLGEQSLSNSVDIQWSSRDGPDVNERNGTGVPPLNDYFNLLPADTLLITPDNTIVTKSRISDTFNPADPIVRIGDIVEYQLLINVQEGTSPNFIVRDDLPQGLQFEQTVSINGQSVAPYPAVVPFSHAAIPAPVLAGDPTAITGSTVSWNVGDLINAGDNNITNDDFVIVYRARVLNLVQPQPQINNTPLPNTANVDYTLATGAALTKTDSELLDLQQPTLSVTKIATPANGDTVIDANEVVQYTVEIFNSGAAPAYDTELLDTIPFGLRSPAVTMISTQLLLGGALPNLAPVYDPVSGIANWNFDTAIPNQYTIPAGDTLQIVYQVTADAGLGAGLNMTNAAQVQFYYSFDNGDTPSVPPITGVREIYGPSNTASVLLTTVLPNALLKENPLDLDVSIGETFTYRITIPEIPQGTALYDVRILDNLTASAADLMFVSAAYVSGSQVFNPVNTSGTDNLVIADQINGIDIPANEFVEIDITVTLRDVPINSASLQFLNTASYTFNQINDDDNSVSIGPGDATPLMTIVEPDLTMDKRGPPGTVNFLAPLPYTLVVENIGSGPAFDTTITDRLPQLPDNLPLVGGTCDTSPINVVVNIFENDETTPARPAPPLALGTDYIVSYTAAPSCELVITTVSDKARIDDTEKLIVSYDAALNVGTQSGAELTNVAGATRWFSLDTPAGVVAGEIREYTETLTDGTPGVLDFEDAFTVIVEAPVLDVQKTVFNVTTNQNPGNNAIPGEILRYTITVSNGGLIDATAVTLIDPIPLNATYIANTVTLNGIPVGQPDAGVSPLIAGIDISSSDLAPPLPGAGVISTGESAIIVFDVLLNPAITSGTVVTNQATMNSPATGLILSDDPNVGGATDPTPTLITSAPAFLVQKTSLDITGDPALLLPGDTLRYTLTVKNIGQENAINSLLSDQIPANTTYVANSTRLNAVVVADPAAGVSALAVGMLINAPENTTAGFLRADTNVAANNVATITFDVVISLTAVNGTIISNQGFFNGSGAGSGVFPQQPSDDPNTALVNDPTIDVVGNVPVIDALKTVIISNDVNGNNSVDPGDRLLYTITTTNIGAVPATNIVLTDAVPVNTTYFPDSVTLNGLPVGQPDGGVSPLVAGIAISSSDLTPPLPTLGNGILSPAVPSVVVFEVVVNAGTLPGTIISNQGFIASNELPTEPTDADGNDANGNQPTLIVVGNVQQLAITKQVLVVGGGAAQAGSELEYVVQVTNIGSINALTVIINDDMALPVAGQKTFVPGSALLNGLPAGISFAGTLLTANIGTLAPAAVAELRFRVVLDVSLTIGTSIINTADVTWDTLPELLSASVSIDIGGTPGSININGQVWNDPDFSNDVSTGELLLPDYRVVLYRNNVQLAETVTDTNGVFTFSGLPPNLPADPYELRYFAPGAIATTASLGDTDSAFTDGAQRITDIVAASGTNVQNLNLPRQANGIVFDSLLRVPVPGVQLSMINQTRSNQQVPASCFDDPVHANQVTMADGYYKFDLNFSDPGRCAQGDEYEIQVQPPTSGFIGSSSVIIPPLTGSDDPAFDVPNCPGTAADRVPATLQHCEISDGDLPAPPTVAPGTQARNPATITGYNLKFLFDAALFTDQIFNNHIAVDSEQEAAVAISKVAGKLNVVRSDLVPYTITFNNTLGVPIFDLSIIDNFPAGFKYVANSARVDGLEIEPVINGRVLTWSGLSAGINESRVIKLLLIVGSGVGEGEYVNTARAMNTLTGGSLSGTATATVRVIPDPAFDCTDIIGKVYEDRNLNTYQDKGEPGVAGVQVATARGLRVTTDKHGRFHITCAVIANEVMGSNFIMKLDDRTLPSGYRVTTENPRVQRATRGKMMKFNFGTAIHRVVRLDLADGVFEKDSTELRPQWRSRIDLLITELEKEGSILRLSYLAENETEDEVEDRLEAIEDLISDRWERLDCCYRLTIETEVFWRKGSPGAGREFKE